MQHVQCGIVWYDVRRLDNLGKIPHDRHDDPMTHAGPSLSISHQLSRFLALQCCIMSQHVAAVAAVFLRSNPPAHRPQSTIHKQYSILGGDACRLSMQFQVGALPRPADLERQRERLMAEAPMDVSKAFTVQSSLEGEREHKIIIRGMNQEYVLKRLDTF